MSSRNIRRLAAERERQEQERKKKEEEEKDNEEAEDFSPHFVQMNPAYEGLVVSSDSESELSALSDNYDEPEDYEQADLPDQVNMPIQADMLDQALLADKANLPEEAKLPEEVKLSEEAKLPDEVNLPDEAKLPDKAKLSDEATLLNEAILPDDASLPDEANLLDEARLPDEAKFSDEASPGNLVETDQLDQYQDEAAAVIPEEDKYGAKKKTYTAAETESNNKKKKRKHKKNKNNKKPEQMDEIDWSLREVNRLLGSPPVKPQEVVVDQMALWAKKIFSIHPNQINVNYELGKVFGEEERLKKARTGTRRMRHEIGLSPDVHPFRVKGLTMTRYKTEGDVKFFKFEHTADYRMRCHTLVLQLRQMLVSQGRHENNLHSETCVEALLENCDFLYYIEEHKSANQALEQAIYFMQSVGEPSFNFVDGKTRLEYQFVENRPFHIAILKYLHVLTNIACHRTALELAKVLLNLDPTDPLAVIYIIDTLAIRAREHQWLLDLMEYWKEKRQCNRLFHMQYSRALALFHVACKKKDYEGIEAAKDALMTAIKNFPPVAVKIMEYTKMNIPEELRYHDIFEPEPNISDSNALNELMVLYAWLIAPRWREPQVWNFYIDTLTDLTDAYDRDPTIREGIWSNGRLRAQLYRRIPTQMRRHLYAIRPMAKYITDGECMPHTEQSVSFNPYPCEGTNTDTYNYFTDWMHQGAPENALMALIQGIFPELYQIGLRNMAEMLAVMDGMEIRTTYGSYMVMGPNSYQPAHENGIPMYRIVFVRPPWPTVDLPNRVIGVFMNGCWQPDTANNQ